VVSRGSRHRSWELTAPGRDPRTLLFGNSKAGLRRADSGPKSRGGPGPGERQDPGPEAKADEALARALFAVLGAVPFERLLARLKADGLLHSDPQASQPPGRLDRFFRALDHGRDWWKFFYPRKPFLEEEVVLGSEVAVVSHCTRECRANGPQNSVASLRLFADDRHPPSRRDMTYYDTDLVERDVAEGRTMEVLRAKLEEAARRRPRVIHLMTTCLPELVGDDPRPILKRLESEFKVSAVWTSKTRDPGISFDAMVARSVERIRFGKGGDSNAVLLAGIPSPAAEAEARRLLEASGLRVVGSLFPNLDVRRLARGSSARAVVWLNPVGWEKFSDAHFLKNGLSVVRFHPPYGVQGTRAWLRRVGSVLGADPKPAEALVSAAEAPLAALRRECGGKTAVLAGDRADLTAMALRGLPMGFSVASLLAELGFRVRCLVRDPGVPGQGWEAESGLGGGVAFERFSTPEELDRLLCDGVDLAFTHLNHDPRLERHGIAGFCEADFEVGVEGLARAGRRLLHRLAGRPFPRHRRFLSP
jgi:hypothetical protein